MGKSSKRATSGIVVMKSLLIQCQYSNCNTAVSYYKMLTLGTFERVHTGSLYYFLLKHESTIISKFKKLVEEKQEYIIGIHIIDQSPWNEIVWQNTKNAKKVD